MLKLNASYSKKVPAEGRKAAPGQGGLLTACRSVV